MNNGYIAVFDSGIGGLSVLKELIRELPNEKYLYLGDNQNAPYGNKGISELKKLTVKNLDYLKHYNIKTLVVACNTLSVNLLSFIKEYSGIATFGIFPPVEKYLLTGEKVLLLATKKTAKNFTPTKNFHVLGLNNLVSDIENNLQNLQMVNIEENLNNSVGEFVDKKRYYDRVILGCTHYEFIKNKILDHFCPQNISSGATFTVNQVKRFFKSNKSLVNHLRFELKFIGANAKTNQNFWVFGGQKGLK